jgi:zinc protease
LVSDTPSVMKYDAEKPQSLLDEDKVIGAIKLGIATQAVNVIPAEEVFRR